MALLDINNLRKSFLRPEGGSSVVVQVPRFELERATQFALQGESGSGKTTFLHLIAGIHTPDEGTVMLDGVELSSLPEVARDQIRGQKIGYIFQNFNLLPAYTCLENVLVGMLFAGKPDRKAAIDLLGRVGLGDRLDYYPRQLSAGQQQRVAVARAMANRPVLVLADEPTGNLDRANAMEALKLIRETCAEIGAALLLVSHDPSVLTQFPTGASFAELNRRSA